MRPRRRGALPLAEPGASHSGAVMSRHRAAGILGIVLPALLAAGCGGGGAVGVASLEGGGTTAGRGEEQAGEQAGEQADLEQALLDFAACMREEGIDFPDPQLDAEGNLDFLPLMAGIGRNSALAGGLEPMRAAAAACRHHLEGVALRFSSFDRTAMQDLLLEYAACVREHGFDLPDPDFTWGPGRRGPFPGMSLDMLQDPAFRQANEACQDLFAGLLPGEGEAGAGG